MKVIKPTTINSSSIVNSNLQETVAQWSNISTYSVGAIVYDELYGIYQAIESNNNKKPSSNSLVWQYLRPTNRWALFDPQVATLSSANQYINFTLATGSLQGLALLNLTGNSVKSTVRDGLNGNIIYQNTQSLIGQVADWYQYFFFELETQRKQAIFVDIPLNYTNTYTTVEIEGTGIVSIGTCTYGKIASIGSAEYGINTGIIDYSVKETNEFGETTFIQRAYSKRMSGRVLINNAELNRVQRTLYDLRATPALWFATADPLLEEALVVFGYYREFSTDISYPTYSYCSLEIEGLI